MTAYLSVGARLVTTGEWVPTKAELRRILTDGMRDHTVLFVSTSPTNPFGGERSWTLELLTRADAAFSVAGPDPYDNRRWFADVRLGPNGKVKVT